MSVPTNVYCDTDEYEGVYFVEDTMEYVFMIKSMAEKGNMEAMNDYAHSLMKGEWDRGRMRSDMENGTLLPPTEDVSKDPYLQIPRDQDLAVEYLKAVANYPKSDGHNVVVAARGFLGYCETLRPTGYDGPRLNYENPHIEHYKESVKGAWENLGKEEEIDNENIPFINYPYCRPELEFFS